MERMELTRRAFIKQGSAALTGVTTLLATPSFATSSSLVESYCKEARRTHLLEDDEEVTIIASDFNKTLFLDINERIMRMSASMIKPFVALTFLQKYGHEQGILREHTPDLKAMLQRSSNSATNRLMRLLGGPKMVEKAIQERYSNIEIVEYIPANGRTYRNRCSGEVYDNFMNDLDSGTLPGNALLRRFMHANESRFFSHIPPKTIIYRKSGTTARLYGEFALINRQDYQGREHAYKIVGIIEKERRTNDFFAWKERKNRVLEGIAAYIHTEMEEEYNLVR